MTPLDIQTRATSEASAIAERRGIEAVSVLVLSDDEAMARSVAPLLAKRLYPARRFGPVLTAEAVEGGHEVTVQVIYPLIAVTIGASARMPVKR